MTPVLFQENAVSFSYAQYVKHLFLSDSPRHVFMTGFYPNGRPYALVQMNPDDAPAAFALSQIKLHEHPGSLKERTVDEYARLAGYGTRFNGTGGMMIGVVDQSNHNRLVGMAAIEALDDERADIGSGPAVYTHGMKSNGSQIYWKTLAVLKQLPPNEHFKELYDVRVAMTAAIGRPFAVMKTNADFIATRYQERGWVNLTRAPKALPHLDLVFETDAAKQGKEVDVLVLPIKTARDWFAHNASGISMPDMLILGSYAHAPQPA